MAASRGATIEGTFREWPLAALLADAAARGFEGTLQATAPEGRPSWIVLARGWIWKARVSTSVPFLGDIAHELGYLDAERLGATLLELACTRRLHGSLLVERNCLTPRQLAHALGEQTLRRVHSLFGLPEGSRFALLEGVDTLADWGGTDWPLVDARRAVVRGVREYPPISHVARVIEAAGERRFKLAGGSDPATLDLAQDERALADAMRAMPMSLGELRELGVLDARRTEGLFYTLRLAGLLVASEAPAAERSSSRVASSGVMWREEPLPRVGRGKEAVAELVGSARKYLLAGNLDRAHALCQHAREADPVEPNVLVLSIWLGLARDRSPLPEVMLCAAESITRIIEAGGVDEEHAFFFRGQIYKRLGNGPRAAHDFRRVLHINPRRHDAALELRLFLARRRAG